MGDTDVQKNEISTESSESADSNVSKPSIDILKEVKPSANIAIEIAKESSLEANLETNFRPSDSSIPSEKPTKEKPPSVEKPIEDKDIEKKSQSEDVMSEVKNKTKEEQKEARNRSDIFSLNENKNLSSTIFSVGGAPSKTIHNTASDASNKSSHSSDTIGTQNSNSSKQSQYRNPVTGIGVSSNDEFKNKPPKRKDGNPLLGVGYKEDNPAPPTGQRIPPGGHSKGLW